MLFTRVRRRLKRLHFKKHPKYLAGVVLFLAILVSVGVFSFTSLNGVENLSLAQNTQWTETAGLGTSVPACASASNAAPTCVGSNPSVTVNWAYDRNENKHPECSSASITFTPSSGTPTVVSGISCPPPAGSYTWTGGAVNTTYTYSVQIYGVGGLDLNWDWRYLNGLRTPPAVGLTSATVNLTMPATEGVYEIWFLPNGGFTPTTKSPVITVTTTPGPPTPATTSGAPNLEVNRTTVAPGGTVTVTVTNGPGNATDYLGIAGATILESAAGTPFTTPNCTPPPTVNLTASPNPVDYNTASTLAWTSTNATSCTGSGGTFGGVRPTTGNFPTGNLTASTPYALTCTGPGGSASDNVTVNVNPPTLGAVLTSVPVGGVAPLTVDLTASTTGSATGNVDYRFDCTNDGSYEAQSLNNPAEVYTAAGACTYPTPGTYTARVRVDRGGLTAMATTIIVVTSGGPTPILDVVPTSLSFSAVEGGPNPANQTFNISNIGGGTMDWTVSKNRTWISISRTSGVDNAPVTVSIDSSALAAGTYTGTVQVVAPSASGSPKDVAITLTVIPPPPTVTLVSSPRLIKPGDSSLLTWTSDAVNCSAPWTSKTTPNDTQSVSPIVTTTYIITCVNSAGITAQAQTTVAVGIIEETKP